MQLQEWAEKATNTEIWKELDRLGEQFDDFCLEGNTVMTQIISDDIDLLEAELTLRGTW